MGYYTAFSLTVTPLVEQEEVSDDEILSKTREAKSISELLEIIAYVDKTKKITPEAIIAHLREVNEEAKFAIDGEGNCLEGSKWYEHESDLKKFSKIYPGWLFSLHGQGEQPEDIWNCYFVDGRCQVEEAVVVIGEFDPSKLV
jgi:hypothetical protein